MNGEDTADVPPARQCTLPTCTREAVDTDRDGQLCRRHLEALDEDKPVTSSDESTTENVPEQIDNETETQEGGGAESAADGGSACTLVDNGCDRPSYSTALEALRDGPLAALGEAFVPIPPGEKGTRRPRTPENLYGAGDDVLAAYIEAGHNYGVVCRDGLAVVDADEPDALRDLLEALPETTWQVSGSRSSEHHFLRVPGLDEDLPLVDPDSGEELGHIKAAEQSYVVGPGSRHPSGNRYGPLEGDTIATLDEADLREAIEPFRPDGVDRDRDERPIEHPDRSGGRDDHDLDVHDVLSRTSYPEGKRCEHPFHGSETGANFMVDDGADTWRCWRHDGTGNARHLVGIDEDVIDCGDWKHGGLSTDTWREIFEAAREAGYDLPEFEPGGVDPVAVLPNAPVERAGRNVWDWRGEDDTLDIEDVRGRTVDMIADALANGTEWLVDVLPTGGKSYGGIAATARADSPPVSIFTTRGRKEQYGQLAAWCDDHGLTHTTLPSFFEECPTAAGVHGDGWAERVRGWYRRGATGQDIHKYAEAALGRPLPCQCDDHGEPVECPYTAAWRFDPDEYDVLLGHYVHAYNPKVVRGRGAIFDEFTGGAYERVLGHGLEGAVSYYLKTRPDVPFEDYTDLLENRHDPQRRVDGIDALEGDLEPDGRSVLEDDGAHAAAPLATFTLLAAAENDLGNGFEHAPFPDDTGRVGIHDRETGTVRVLTPPALDAARAVIALDGTPTPALWRLTLGVTLRHRQVLDDDERAEYLTEALGHSIVSTTPWLKPYNSPDHVNVDDDAALLEAIADTHGEKPGVITTHTALTEYAKADVLAYEEDTGAVTDGPADRVRWYGNVLGSNEFKHKRVGAVIGSNHYGDGYIKRWGAYAGEAVERGEGKGTDLSYGAFGDDVLTHMREHDTLQAARRLGGGGNGAVIYVHTDTLAEWVPIAGEGQVIRPKTDGERQVLDAVDALGRDYWTTAEIADAVEIGARRVRQILNRFVDRGVVRKGQATEDGRAVEWADAGLEELPEHVDLPDVDVAAEESCGNARSKTIYTHISGTSPTRRGATLGDSAGEGVATDGGRPNGGDRPPDDPV
jgi:hypothetical protein